jgi:hypothetical protein
VKQFSTTLLLPVVVRRMPLLRRPVSAGITIEF